MKILFKVTSSLVLSVAFLFAPILRADKKETVNVLFIGNSFTARHNIPKLVETIFEEGQPGVDFNCERIDYGGQDLFKHYELYRSQSMVRLNTITVPEIEEYINHIQGLLAMESEPEFFTNYWAKTGLKAQSWKGLNQNLQRSVGIQKNIIKRIGWNGRVKWDYLVLQSYKDIVADPDAGYAEYAVKWAELAEKEGIKVILYITAPDTQNAQPVTEPVNPEQTDMEMEAIRKLANRIQPHAVVPVPLAIKNIQKGGTDMTFRYVKDFHPNQTTAFLVANMFYAAFFGESTEGLKFNSVTESKLDKDGKDPDGGDATVVFDDVTKEYLQEAAFEAVNQFKQTE